jgi:hypothetical protein
MPPNADLSSTRAKLFEDYTTESTLRAAVSDVFAYAHQGPALWRNTISANSSDSAHAASLLSGILVVGSLRRLLRAQPPFVCCQAFANS